ncbi:MAG: hypothetical protein GC171_12745 [Terrimonas sp.]|nr:hypothetical protein [Terrimonas sp.]
MKLLTYMIFIFSIGCNSRNKAVVNIKKDSIAYELIKDNLYHDIAGNLYFRVMDMSNPEKPVSRYLSIVWNANQCDSINGGKMLLKDVVDAKSFEKILGFYYRDKNRFYIFNEMSDGGTFAVLNEIDFSSFKVLSNYYAKDKNNVYYKSNVISQADIPTFKVFPKILNGDTLWQYAKDKNHYYSFGDIIPDSELKLYELNE